jgi:hypothetical protein
MTINVIGVDPGLVDTGLVRLSFHPSLRRVSVAFSAIADAEKDTGPVVQWIRNGTDGPSHVFIEQYVPRPGMATTGRMKELESKLRRELPNATLLRNMGVKQVIPQELMQVLGVWTFKKSTHHQDLRSAARIALFGMAKDSELNPVLTAVVTAHLDGSPWAVDHVS